MRTGSPRPHPPSAVAVAEVMTAGVICCSAETPLDEVAALMATSRVHAVAVCRVGDRAGDPLGAWAFVSDTDLLAALAAGRFDGLTAGAIAGTELLSVRAEEPVRDAAVLMARHRVSHVVVIRDGVPAGVLSSLDVARSVAASRTADR